MSRFSPTLMEHFLEPRNRGPLPARTHQGIVGHPGKGPFFVLHLVVKEDRICQAAFECNGCGVTVACGSALTEWLSQRPLIEARAFTSADLDHLLEGLPPDKRHCVENAAKALKNALEGKR